MPSSAGFLYKVSDKAEQVQCMTLVVNKARRCEYSKPVDA